MRDDRTYSHERYAKLLDGIMGEIKKLGDLKGGEYAGDVDRLANFRRNAENVGVKKETVWAIYAGKHWDALMQYINDNEAGRSRSRLETIDGRVHDLIVYLILFAAMLDENKGEQPNEEPKRTGIRIPHPSTELEA